jgi:hypothetical protein
MRPGMGATPTPGTGTGTAPMMPGMGATPTPGMGTGTSPMMPGMGATPTPGMGTGTSPMRPGMNGTPAPGMGTGTSPMRPGMNGSPAPGMGTGTVPMNPQSMTTPGNHQAMPQMPSNMSPVNTPSPTLNNPQEMPYYNPMMQGGNMPYMSYPPYQGIPNMYLPNTNPYNVPMGIPMFPLYGYDNSADLDHDLEYMKQLYPKTAKAIQKEIDNECDKIEYDGSMMFDEYPDKESLDKLIDRVYDRIKQIEDEPQVEINSLYFYPPRRNTNYLRDIVSLLFLSEIFNRRRRHRGRKRWY